MQCYKPLYSLECPCSSGDGDNQCSVVAKLTTTLTQYFGFVGFRTGHKESVLSALHGKDVFLHLATGAGKSLSMFLVPLTYSTKAVGVIISPLNSLMEEQVSIVIVSVDVS